MYDVICNGNHRASITPSTLERNAFAEMRYGPADQSTVMLLSHQTRTIAFNALAGKVRYFR